MVSFENAEKERQATFRAESSTISEQGRSPKDDKGIRNAHLLKPGCEQENLYKPLRGKANALKFFAERGIKWHRTGRSGDTRGGSGPTRNMASSQVMCVNFMLPLAKIDGALAAALRAVDDDVTGVVSIKHEGRKSPVEFEWVGVPLSLECSSSRGANSTSVDTFVIAETKTGSRRAYLIEWKYTEPPNRRNYGPSTDGYKTRRGRYSGLYHTESSSFSHEVPMTKLMYGDFYQLMRNRLLADRMVANKELGVSDAKVVLVIPEGNVAFQKPTYLAKRFPDLGESVSEVFSATLNEPEKSFCTVSPTRLLEAVERECDETPAISEWATYMRKRYGL